MTNFVDGSFVQVGRHGSALKCLCVALGLLCLAFLTACGVGKPSKDFYLRVTVEATYNGKAVSGSSVINQPWYHSAPRGYTQGEALSIDLGGNKKVYMVHVGREYRRLYAPAIFIAFHPIHNPEGKKRPREEEEKALLGIPYGTKVQWHYNRAIKGRGRGQYPLLVGFKDVNDPGSVFMVKTEAPARIFGGTFKMKSIHFERVSPDTPLTRQIHDELPWTDGNHPHWKSYIADGGWGSTLCTDPKTKSLSEAKLCERLRRSNFEFILRGS